MVKPPEPYPQQESDQPPIPAPAWHTAALIALIVGVAAVGTLLARAPAPSAPVPAGRIATYLPMAVVPLLLTGYVGWLGRSRNALPALLGPRWRGLRRVPVDLAIGAACVLVIVALERALSTLASPVDARRQAALAAMLPRTAGERATWLLVAAAVGFGEEVVYRGYLRAQLATFTGRPWLGVVLQAILFGVAHLNQGAPSALRIAAYGLLLGVVVAWRGSLLPAIYAHVAIDAASAL